MYSGKSGCNRATWLHSGKFVVFGKSVGILANVALFGQKLLYSGMGGCNGAKMLYSVKSGCIREKMVVFGLSCLIREK